LAVAEAAAYAPTAGSGFLKVELKKLSEAGQVIVHGATKSLERDK
jgi:hypothetical protein